MEWMVMGQTQLQGESAPDWFAISGWVFTIVFGLITVWAFFDQRRSARYLKQVEKDWQGQYTEDQIVALKSEYAKLQRQVQREVPQEARRVFLHDRIATLSSSIASLYVQYEEVRRELGKLPPWSELNPRLERMIEQDIMPSYLAQQRLQRTIYIFVVLIFVNIAVPFFLPLGLPYILEIIRSVESIFAFYFEPTTLLSYFAGVVLVTMMAYILPITRESIPKSFRALRWSKREVSWMLLFLLPFWAVPVCILAWGLSPRNYDAQMLLGMASIIPLGLSLRLLRLIFSRRATVALVVIAFAILALVRYLTWYAII